MDLDRAKLMEAPLRELEDDMRTWAEEADLGRTVRAALNRATDYLEAARDAYFDATGYLWDYYGEPVDAEVVDGDNETVSQSIDSAAADPFELTVQERDRMQRERALDLAVRSGEKGDAVTVAERYYAFMKGEDNDR